MSEKNWKISFCIVCANRLHQLQATLLENIKQNEDYDELEFILLDYNSQDDMEKWAQGHLMEYISAGKLTYYRTTEPEVFNHSHSKNVAFKLAQGEIVCNINADHYTGKGFASYINKKFNENNNIVLTPIGFYEKETNYYAPQDTFGRVCVRKSDFELIKGFDERMKQYGFEDYDLVDRLEMRGIRRIMIDDRSFLEFITHAETERYTLNISDVMYVYVNYSTPSESEVIICYNDGRFEKGTVTDYTTLDAPNYIYAYKPRIFRIPFVVRNGGENGWMEGNWESDDHAFRLVARTGEQIILTKDTFPDACGTLQEKATALSYYPITDAYIIEVLLRLRMYFYNRYLMEDNLDQKGINVNPGTFGNTTVFKNFDYGSAITI